MLPTRRVVLTVSAAALGVSLLVPSAGSAHAPDRAQAHAPKVRTADQVLTDMTLAQRVGQLFMVGTPADEVDRATKRQISRFHVGNVILTGRSYDGVEKPARVSRAMRSQVSAASTDGVGLLVATDQEGGQVQVLQGPGFAAMPSALEQGTWAPARLRAAAKTWARQLRKAGVDLDLAPVLDTVPGRKAAKHNPPIGRYHREFGYTPRVVTRHGLAFLRGMTDGGVVPTVKHFPGLGRVNANTDTKAGVTDRVTTRHDAYLKPFRAAVEAGAPFVMMSTAYYARLDADRPAAFSPFVVDTMLRGDLGFQGVVVSDDLARAAQVARFTPAGRALRFIGAGGDIVLTVDPDPVPAMYAAVLARARHDEAFRAKVDAAALRVLTAKQHRHLL
ncbi:MULTISPECIES: glycoside hydrolase family 3 N-terminal domain-containing protein [unclassified Nocardioides]|uniref:glycoside hydrolase family 3 N-terminal domain-containing protein n=1 Tax=unclassified Nocardioides TaxID=2615069 RepID=UPI0009F019B5|nr:MULTISPECIES: glycoside hydrolase family 3 N-terminal domain-containing protein [unclassified Nocardioides]GAW51954.1 glycoside hydrolase family 3 protein [Nocardioides sp. PD653-B2]GAW56440.1 glycoside hydrolase family 3 protein [Nocardioides sp. PD653]